MTKRPHDSNFRQTIPVRVDIGKKPNMPPDDRFHKNVFGLDPKDAQHITDNVDEHGVMWVSILDPVYPAGCGKRTVFGAMQIIHALGGYPLNVKEAHAGAEAIERMIAHNFSEVSKVGVAFPCLGTQYYSPEDEHPAFTLLWHRLLEGASCHRFHFCRLMKFWPDAVREPLFCPAEWRIPFAIPAESVSSFTAAIVPDEVEVE